MRISLFVVFLFFVSSVFSQKPRQAYCEVVVWPHHVRYHAAVTFDFGMQTYTAAMLYDSKNRPLRFISGMDAVNYLSKRGWRVITSYYKTASKNESTHFVMEKTVANEKQVIEGLILKEINLDEFYKKMQIPDYSPDR